MFAEYNVRSKLRDEPDTVVLREEEEGRELTLEAVFRAAKIDPASFSIDAFNRTGTIVEIGTDASPWGLGGWLSVIGVIAQYFASPLTQEDSDKFGLPLADVCGQQVWEALARPVAVVLWPTSGSNKALCLKSRVTTSQH